MSTAEASITEKCSVVLEKKNYNEVSFSHSSKTSNPRTATNNLQLAKESHNLKVKFWITNPHSNQIPRTRDLDSGRTPTQTESRFRNTSLEERDKMPK